MPDDVNLLELRNRHLEAGAALRTALRDRYSADSAFAFTYLDQPVKIYKGADGLYWKRIFRTGDWVEGPDGQPMNITSKVLDDIIAAFNANVWPHVTAPLSHQNLPHENTGFVRSLRKVSEEGIDYLAAGFEIIDKEIEQKIAAGLIADVSCGLLINYTDKETGTVWPTVLWHTCLTNEPFVRGLGDWTSEIAATRVGDKAYVFTEKGVKRMGEGTGSNNETVTLDAFNEEKRRREALEAQVAELLASNQSSTIDLKLQAFKDKLPPAVIGVVRDVLLASSKIATKLTFTEKTKIQRDGKEVEEDQTVERTFSEAIFKILEAIPESRVLSGATGVTSPGSRPPVNSGSADKMSADEVKETADKILLQLNRAPKASSNGTAK